MPKFVALDPRTLTAEQMQKAVAFYGTIKRKAFLPAHNLSTDPIRAELDEFVLRELVQCGPALSVAAGMIDVLREKLRAEPSYNGGR